MILPLIYPNEPETATWLTTHEQFIAITRLRLADPAKAKGKQLSYEDTKSALMTWEIVEGKDIVDVIWLDGWRVCVSISKA